MSKDYIHKYWINKAKQKKHEAGASWEDIHMMELETMEIRKYIKRNQKVLDAGCANGFSTANIFPNDEPNYLVAFDFVRLMVENAKIQFRKNGYKKLKYRFYHADIREIPEKDESFDIAYTIRVLINLPNWEDQKKALNELIRVTRVGGLVIISEAFWGALQNLNALRIIAGLPPLYEHDFNRYLKENILESYLKERNLSYKVSQFSSLYYLGTRLVRDLNPSIPEGYNNEINKDFFDLCLKYDAGDLGIQKQYVIEKR